VTLPGLIPTIVIMLIMRMGSMIDAGYESIILLYQPTTYETADVFSTFIYRIGLENAQFSMGAAAGVFNSVVALAMVSAANLISRKVSEVSLW
jgi:putative aldouronate transport system permease protein